MFDSSNKRILILLILEILQDYTDSNHKLQQQEIVKLLHQNYGIECDRRSVKNNVLALIDFGYDISIEDGYCLLSRKFDDAELRMLIDSVLFSKTISKNQAKDLINKLKSMSNKYFSAKVSHISNLPELQHTDNKQVLYSLDILNDAISEGRKVSFIYNTYKSDFKLHPKREEKYVVNPYQMVANNGRYYLIGNYDKYNNISHYRIDRMTKVEMLDEQVKSIHCVGGCENGLNLPSHMAEHIYMFSGDAIHVKLEVDSFLMSELVDWFGKDFHILENNDGTLIISVKCNENAMKFWALQYGPYVEVLEPIALRETIKKEVCGMYEKYVLGEKGIDG